MHNKKNIFLLIDCLNRFQGGAERQILELVKNLDKDKYQIYIGCLSKRDLALKEMEKYGALTFTFKVDRIYSPSGIRQGLRFVDLLKRENIHILMTYHFGSDIWGTIFGRLARTPRIISNRRDAGFWRNRSHILAYKFINKFVNKIVVVSRAVQDVVIKTEKVESERIRIIHNGIDLKRFEENGLEPRKNEFFNISQDAKIIGCVGNIRPVKGHQYLIKAARLIRDRVPESHFIFVGGILEGEEAFEQSLQNIVEEECMTDYVHFLGRRQDIPKILKLMDICVLPSLSEGLSNTLLEYMAAGKAIVASNVGGNSELIIDQKNGLLAKAADVQGLADKVTQLLKDSDLCLRLGKEARSDVQKNFSIEHMIKEYGELIEEVLCAKKKNI